MGNADYNVALLAVILAAAAFIVTFLQALLQYTSSSSARHKCSTAAIGGAHALVKFRWTFVSWRLKVYYPMLDFSYTKVIYQFDSQARNSIDGQAIIRQIVGRNSKWIWIPREAKHKLNWRHIADSMNVLVVDDDDQEPITVSDIGKGNPRNALRFLWWRVRNPLQPFLRYRASWAQALAVLSINDMSRMKIVAVDADTIPSSLDVPVQRVGLRSLGQLAFIMGFTSVKIDVQNRYFRASSPFGTISTEEVQVLGKILRFDGDILVMHAQVSRCDPFWLYFGGKLVMARLTVGRYDMNGLFAPLNLIHQAIASNLSKDDFYSLTKGNALTSHREGGLFLKEAHTMKNLSENIANSLLSESMRASEDDPAYETLRRWKYEYRYMPPDSGLQELLLKENLANDEKTSERLMNDWRKQMGKELPTIFVAAMFINIHGVVTGYPSKPLLAPFAWWFEQRAKAIYERRPFLEIPDFVETLKSPNKDSWVRLNSHVLLSTAVGATQVGTFGWGVTAMRDIYNSTSDAMQDRVLPKDTADPLAVQAVVSHRSCALLQNFKPLDWERDVREELTALTQGFEPMTLLWAQIVILDVAIQYLIRGGWDPSTYGQGIDSDGRPPEAGNLDIDYTWSAIDAQVVFAIIQIWNKKGYAEEQAEAERQEAAATAAAEANKSGHSSEVQSMKSSIDEEGSHRDAAAAELAHARQAEEREKEDAADEEKLKAKIQDEHTAEQDENHEKPQDIELEDLPASVVGTKEFDQPGGQGLAPEKERGSPESSTRKAAYARDPFSSSQSRQSTSASGKSREDSDTAPWDLTASLEKYSGLKFGIDDAEADAAARRRPKFQQLADLFELRALFMIALLWNYPDSSDVYTLESDDVEMPMV